VILLILLWGAGGHQVVREGEAESRMFRFSEQCISDYVNMCREYNTFDDVYACFSRNEQYLSEECQSTLFLRDIEDINEPVVSEANSVENLQVLIGQYEANLNELNIIFERLKVMAASFGYNLPNHGGDSFNYDGEHHHGGRHHHGGGHHNGGDSFDYEGEHHHGGRHHNGGGSNTFGGDSFGGDSDSFGGESNTFGGDSNTFGGDSNTFGGDSYNYGGSDNGNYNDQGFGDCTGGAGAERNFSHSFFGGAIHALGFGLLLAFVACVVKRLICRCCRTQNGCERNESVERAEVHVRYGDPEYKILSSGDSPREKFCEGESTL